MNQVLERRMGHAKRTLFGQLQNEFGKTGAGQTHVVHNGICVAQVSLLERRCHFEQLCAVSLVFLFHSANASVALSLASDFHF